MQNNKFGTEAKTFTNNTQDNHQQLIKPLRRRKPYAKRFCSAKADGTVILLRQQVPSKLTNNCVISPWL